MTKLEKLKSIIKEDGVGGIGAGPTNAVAAHGTTIAGASPGEMPPVNLQKRKKKSLPKHVMGRFKRNPPQM
jgi:predicted AlkP superfamily phosphohydrolase/phosphomutase